MTDASGAQLLHQHDAFGNLIETRDALQNKITISYDLRGRKVAMNDPDAGQSSYTYDALGQLVKQQNANQLTAGNPLFGKATTMEYDILGRMTKRIEPEYTSNWAYDTCATGKCVGKLVTTTTSNGVNRTLVYDNLGRPINTRTDITSGPSFASAVSYDSITGRVNTQTYPTGLQVGYSYTAGAGALEKLTLKTAANVTPLPATVGGTAAAPKTLPINTVLWQARVVNAWGKIEQSSYGDNVSASNVLSKAVFEAATGRTTALTAGTGGISNVLNQTFAWDSLSNLTARADNIGDAVAGAVSESFQYGDSLNRLTSYTVSAPGIIGSARTVTLQYNALGMLLYKSDVGNYSYPAQGQTSVRPHALQSVAPTGDAGTLNTGYGYDASGNMVTATGSKYSTVAYTSFNLPDSNIGLKGPSGSPQYTWQYDESHQRIKEVHVNASGTRTTWMLHPDIAGGLGFESEVTAGTTSNRHYLTAGGQTIGVLVSTGALPTLALGHTAPAVLPSMALVKVEYWYKDHLGSLVATADHTGAVTARYAYDPFGKRRSTNGNYDSFGNIVVDWTTNTNAGGDRGFTGHEQLDDLGLVHMNGRIFDPTIAKFMQADPHMTDPMNLQNYNRYAYCYNNPLTCTDPTGLDLFSDIRDSVLHPDQLLNHIGDVIATDPNARIIASIAAAYFIGPGYSSFLGGGFGQAAIAGFVSGAISSGNIEGALQGAFTAGMFYGAGELIGGAYTDGFKLTGGEAIAVHGVVGCVTSAAGGGSCSSGALSAAFSNAATVNNLIPDNAIGGTVASAVIGGTASVLGGGSFENGARTAAFGYLFNHWAHELELMAYGREAHQLLQDDMKTRGLTVERSSLGANKVDGRFDIGDAGTNEVWEIKRNSNAGRAAGELALDNYTDGTGLRRGGNLPTLAVGQEKSIFGVDAVYTFKNDGGGLITYTRESFSSGNGIGVSATSVSAVLAPLTTVLRFLIP